MTPEDFAEALVDDLAPVRPAIGWMRALLTWTSLAWVFVSVLVLATGPLREGAIATLAITPRYTLEFALAVLGGLAAIAAGLELGVPGHPGTIRLLLPSVALLLGWLALLGYGLLDPVIETGMLGKRALCSYQTFAFALPPLALALYALRQRALFARTATGVLVGIGAAAIPAAWMQLACLYDPLHSLLFHLIPVALAGGLGGLAAHWILPRH
ncbi:MAG: NrsF family protein [Myxococcota bacterium]